MQILGNKKRGRTFWPLGQKKKGVALISFLSFFKAPPPPPPSIFPYLNKSVRLRLFRIAAAPIIKDEGDRRGASRSWNEVYKLFVASLQKWARDMLSVIFLFCC